MVIEFVKIHPVGIPKGAIKEVDEKLGNRLITEGFAKESTQETLDNAKAKREAEEKAKVQELKKISLVQNEKDCDCKEEEETDCEDCRKRAKARGQKKTVVRKTTKKKATTKK